MGDDGWPLKSDENFGKPILTHSLIQLLEQLKQPRILVLGDLILDRYVHGSVSRISQEGPVPILLSQQQHEMPGGAANVACNLSAMGARVSLAGLIGSDMEGRRLKELIRKASCKTSLILCDQRPTSVKTRFLCQGQQLLRWDEEETHEINRRQSSGWWKKIKSELIQCDLLVLSDYAKGVLSQTLIEKCISFCNRSSIPVLVDPKGQDFSKYRGATLITPNLLECSLASGLDIESDEDLKKAGRKLLRSGQCRYVIVTQGPDGMSLIGKNKFFHQSTLAKSVYDVSGAGDSAIAALALAWSSSLSPEDCLKIANLAGGIAVSRLGAYPVSFQDLFKALGDSENMKIVSLKHLLLLREGQRKNKKSVVLTTGCFDLLHAGHLSLLRDAKKQGDILVVGINADKSITKLKGPSRPIIDQNQRAHLLAGFEVVDYVVVFDQASPENLIRKLAPEVWVKGGDYGENDNNPVFQREWKALKKAGGRLYLTPFVKGHSTSLLVKRIKKR
jgi:D-beta-D-heptose 7-phosphate kinase/D-beta-D-heptose 1-phosphate adenosyltransferase